MADDDGKQQILVGIAFALVFVLRHLFHWFFYKWRFGERVIVLGSSPEALTLTRMLRDNPMAGFEVRGLIEEVGQPQLETTADDAETEEKAPPTDERREDLTIHLPGRAGEPGGKFFGLLEGPTHEAPFGDDDVFEVAPTGLESC